MKLPNWFKIAWWVLLLGFASYVIVRRQDAIVSGQMSLGDLLVVLIWIALVLAPLFQEIDLFGLKFNQRINELKGELVGLRAEIRNSIDVRTQINPTFQISSPPPDGQLPMIEQRIRRILDDTLRYYGVAPPKEAIPTDVPEDALFLFKTRYQIEREISRIWEQRMSSEWFIRPRSTLQMLIDLGNEGFIDHRLVSVIRDVYRVASPAIHAREVTQAQLSFVREVTPDLITALKAIQ